jgi:hypothetical protein
MILVILHFYSFLFSLGCGCFSGVDIGEERV